MISNCFRSSNVAAKEHVSANVNRNALKGTMLSSIGSDRESSRRDCDQLKSDCRDLNLSPYNAICGKYRQIDVQARTQSRIRLILEYLCLHGVFGVAA